MELMKLIFTIALTMAITITLTMQGIRDVEDKPLSSSFEHTHDISSSIITPADELERAVLPSKRGSRFLAQAKNPRAADHCHKDNDVCYSEGKNSTCCNNKCIDFSTDKSNCGACKNKCKYTQSCCRGQCVYLSYDKRHCGSCNSRCEKGKYCVYGMCDYA